MIFQATYLVYGHYAYIDWQPADKTVSNLRVPPGLKTVVIGHIKALADRNSSGQNILSWDYSQFSYRVISDLDLNQLLLFARHLRIEGSPQAPSVSVVGLS
jgi:hypothetical protein